MNAKRYGLPILAMLVFSGALKGATEALYDEKADAQRNVSMAIAKAAKSRKNVVLIFGANW